MNEVSECLRRPILPLVGIAALCVLLITLIPPQNVHADYTFSKILDTSTFRPGTSDRFSNFYDVYHDGAYVSFVGTAASGAKGVYLWNGSQLVTVADTSSATPNAAGVFTNFRSLSLDDGRLAFSAEGSSVDGIYTTLGGSLRRVADSTTIMPGSSVPFRDFDFGTDVEIAGSRIAFSAFGTNGTTIFNEGVYLEDAGELQVIADRSNAIPGFAENFLFFSEVDLDATDVVYSGGRGTGGGNGMYTTDGSVSGVHRIVYNADRALPGLTQPNSVFTPNSMRTDDGAIAFKASGDNDFDAIFIDRAGVIETVATTQTPDPVTNANFGGFYNLSLDNSEVAFVGGTTGPTGLYRYADGDIEKIINTADFLDGKDISWVSIFPGALRGGNMAFMANFTDSSVGLYLAEKETTSVVEEITIAPAFDVQLTPGSVVTLQEGATTLAIDGGFGLHSAPKKHILMEFPIDDIPAGVDILSATLTLDGISGSGNVSIAIDGYVGDGLASISDANAATSPLAVSSSYTASSNIAIEINTAFLQSILGLESHIGLRLSTTLNGVLNIASMESTSGVAPRLHLEYEVPISQPGDFDDDGDVDGRDFLLWQRNPSVGNLADWQSNHGANFTAVTAVPEVSSFLAFSSLLPFLIVYSRFRL
jgi:hypothetical protein